VTDNNTWQSPAGMPTPPPSPYGAPAANTPPPPASPAPPPAPGQYAPPLPPGQFPPPAGFYPPPPTPVFGAGFAPPAPTAGGPAWTPPPKPGLIPLRPLGFGTLLGASFQVMRRNPKPTLGVALLFNGAIILLLGIIVAFVVITVFGRIQNATVDDSDEVVAGAVGIGIVAALIPVALSLIVSAIIQGIVSLEVARGTIGERLRFSGLWKLAKGRVGALIGWSALLVAAFSVVIVVFALLITVVAVASTDAGPGPAIGTIFLVVLGGVALSLWLTTKLCLVPSILMLERLTLGSAIARSWTLTRGFFWKTLGITLLVNIIIQTATQIISVPISLVATLLGSLINVNSEEETALVIGVASAIASAVVSIVLGAVASVLSASVVTLIYIDIRFRREGLDLELSRFVEARQSGDTSIANPYERATHSTQPANDSPWA